MRVLFGLTACACSTAAAVASLVGSDPSYVVQIHSSRDGFVPPPNAAAELRTQYMATESGHRFECFLPLSPLQKEERDKQLGEQHESQQTSKEDNFLSFSRTASKKIRPMCLQYVDAEDKWVYEICPGVLIRKVSLPEHKKTQSSREISHSEDVKQPKVKAHEVVELASYSRDGAEKSVNYNEFSDNEFHSRLGVYPRDLYTQTFRSRTYSTGDVKIQFICSASARDDFVAAVQWSRPEDAPKQPTAFVIASRVFCSAKHLGSGGDEEVFTVSSLLRPLSELHTCIKRNEGWWTYEFCFGHGIRQYHRESDGKISSEFSLGSYNLKQNEELEATGDALAFEHIDATHDSSRPAFVELYTGGTHCKEFDLSTPRKSKVFYYCSQGSSNHHILSVKETQTCAYTIKISSPVVCYHPHFITDEPKTEEKAEVVHCIPALDETSEQEQNPTTQAPPSEQVRGVLQEVEVTAT